MPSPELVVVASFTLAAEAEVAKGALDVAGIDAMIRTDNAGGAYPAVGTAELMVRAEDAERARRVLDESHGA